MKRALLTAMTVLAIAAPRSVFGQTTDAKFDPTPEPATPRVLPGSIGGALSLGYDATLFDRRVDGVRGVDSLMLGASLEASSPPLWGVIASIGVDSLWRLTSVFGDEDAAEDNDTSFYIGLSTAIESWRLSLTWSHAVETGQWSNLRRAEQDVTAVVAYVIPRGDDGSLSPAVVLGHGFNGDDGEDYHYVGAELVLNQALSPVWQVEAVLAFYHTRYDDASLGQGTGRCDTLLKAGLILERELGDSLSAVASLTVESQWSNDVEERYRSLSSYLGIRYLF